MKRVIFENNPLVEVILQFRFPTILSINANEPVDFQETIRQEYPIYQPGVENQQEIQIVAKNNMFLPSIVNKQQNKNYAFISMDGKYKINLTSSFISISTINYSRWEQFYQHFEGALRAFIEIYKPAFFERIGLRYVDAISKEKLGLQDKKWRDLINENWLGPLAICEDESVALSNSDSEFILEDGITRLKIHTGLGNLNNSSEKVFVVDTDFIYINNIDKNAYGDIVDQLHNHSKFFIEHVIKDELFQAMDPRDIS